MASFALAALCGAGGGAGGGAWAEDAQPNYYYSLDAQGRPVFTQVLRWSSDENALEYELVVRKAGPAGAEGGDSEVLRTRTSEAKAEVRLEVGDYQYMITTFNLLGRAEAETGWLPMRVLKAEIPSISQVSPSKILMDEHADRRVTVSGSRLVSGCKVLLAQGQTTLQGTELRRDGDESLVVLFPDEAYLGGEYALEVENPGGLRAVLDGKLSISPPLPAAESLSPTQGFVFGPAELKARHTIEFSWRPVEGATDYRLAIYPEGKAEPALAKEGLRDPGYAIDDLSVLDRGVYAWKVVALRRGADGELEQSGLEASSTFSIQLPALKQAGAKAGGTYFGH